MHIKIIILFWIFAGILFDYFLAFIFNKQSRRGDIPVKVFVSDIRLHHSMLGLILILIGLFINFYSLVLIGFGIGIIIGHTIRARKLILTEKK